MTLRYRSADMFYRRKSLRILECWPCSRLGGSLPHNQDVSASKTSLVEVATSGPLRRWLWQPFVRQVVRDDIYAKTWSQDEVAIRIPPRNTSTLYPHLHPNSQLCLTSHLPYTLTPSITRRVIRFKHTAQHGYIICKLQQTCRQSLTTLTNSNSS